MRLMTSAEYWNYDYDLPKIPWTIILGISDGLDQDSLLVVPSHHLYSPTKDVVCWCTWSLHRWGHIMVRLPSGLPTLCSEWHSSPCTNRRLSTFARWSWCSPVTWHRRHKWYKNLGMYSILFYVPLKNINSTVEFLSLTLCALIFMLLSVAVTIGAALPPPAPRNDFHTLERSKLFDIILWAHYRQEAT